MQNLHFDQYEFDYPASEESLDLVIGTTEQFRDLRAFACQAGIDPGVGPPVWERPRRSLTGLNCFEPPLKYIHRFAGLEFDDSTAQAVVLQDDGDEAELVIMAGRYFVWYHWSTTA